MPDINWALFAPIIILQVILQVVALVSCLQMEELKGPKWVWVLIILLGGMLGPVLYFTIARRNV